MNEKPSSNLNQADEMMLLMQRLRTLQLRLNSVDPVAAQESEERVLNWRNFLGEMKGREARRRQLHSYVSNSMNLATGEFGQSFEEKFLPRLDQSFQTLIPAIESRAAAVSGMRALELEDEFGGRLSALERRNVNADAQLAELRAACAEVYKRFSEVNGRLDQIWSDDNTEGLGGWRVAFKKANQERTASEKTPLQAFRDDSLIDESDLDGPGWVGMDCPQCKEPTGRRKRRSGLKDDLLSLVNIAPFWCPRCMVRFYRVRPGKRRRVAG